MSNSIMQSSNNKLKWSKAPESVLMIKKIDIELVEPFIKCVSWLIHSRNLKVFVQEPVLLENEVNTHEKFGEIADKVEVFSEDSCIDLVVCLGGDGTLLYSASLFQRQMPPIVPFNMGSLGFMTCHIFSDFKETLSNVLDGKASIMLRSRLKCVLTKLESLVCLYSDK